jgi:hypothetical protein
MLEMACHTAMGVALGLGFAFALMFIDAFGIATMIAHSYEPKAALAVFVGTFTIAFALGTTLTGLVFTIMEER